MKVQRAIYFSFVACFFFAIAFSYAVPTMMGALFAILLFPVKRRLRKATRLGALIMTITITCLFVIPVFLLLIYAIKNAFSDLDDLKSILASKTPLFDAFMTIKPIQKMLHFITESFPVSSVALTESAFDLLVMTGKRLGLSIGELAKQLPSAMLSLLVGVVSFYFFLKDGKSLVFFLERHSCFNPHQTQELFLSITQICRGVILAAIVSGCVQAVIGMSVCAAVGMSNLTLVTVGIFFGSFIPIVGCMPVILLLALTSSVRLGANAALVIFACGLVLLSIDGAIRPWFLKGSTNLHPLLAFITALGGVHLLGFSGVFLGPIIAAIFVKFIDLLSQKEIKSE